MFLNVQKSSKEMRIIFNHSGSNAIHMVEGIEVVDDLKVLGFMIDSKFGFSKHILPKLYYGINVWGGSNVKVVDDLKVMTSRALRLLMTSKCWGL